MAQPQSHDPRVAPGEENAVVPFPVGALQSCLPHTTAWSHIWGRQALRESYHRDSPGAKRQHNHLDSCSHNALAPSTCLTLGLRKPQRRKEHGLGLLLGKTKDTCTGGTEILCDSVGLTCFSTQILWERACTRGQGSLTEPNHQSFYFNNRRADSTPDRAVTATELSRRLPTLSSAHSGYHNTNHTHYQRNNFHFEKDMAGIRTKTNGLTQSTQGHFHIKTVL